MVDFLCSGKCNFWCKVGYDTIPMMAFVEAYRAHQGVLLLFLLFYGFSGGAERLKLPFISLDVSPLF